MGAGRRPAKQQGEGGRESEITRGWGQALISKHWHLIGQVAWLSPAGKTSLTQLTPRHVAAPHLKCQFIQVYLFGTKLYYGKSYSNP